jgi:uncharacterized protein (TIGR00255 family)
MTGFARADGSSDVARWYWEIRSVNGRGLDARIRVPAGLEAIEIRAREAVSRHFTRGNISATLAYRREAGEGQLRLNEVALAQVIAAARDVVGRVETASISADGLLALKGVLETVEPDEGPAEREATANAIVATLEVALAGVVRARRDEGARLTVVVGAHIDEIERLVEEVRRSAARGPEVARSRMEEQIKRLLDGMPGLDPQRLHQEAVVLATRSDIEEEIKRLDAHVAAARDLMTLSDAAGRRLDFLAQEFNREANTICSKAFDGEITRLGLALKVVIDQFREQIQNIE